MGCAESAGSGHSPVPAAVGDLGCGLHSLYLPAASGTPEQPLAPGTMLLSRFSHVRLCATP